jgi:hypothetical protein
MDEAYETIQHGPFTITIYNDPDPMSPREWDNIGRVQGCNEWTFSDGSSADAGAAYREVRETEPGGIIALPIKVVDGPYTMVRETSDWGYADGIYWAAVDETLAVADHGFRTIIEVKDAMRAELATLNQWLEGDVWGYVVTDPLGTHVSSCWGFFGTEEAKSEGYAAARWAISSTPRWVLEQLIAWGDIDPADFDDAARRDMDYAGTNA